MTTRPWQDLPTPPAKLTPCGRLTDTPEKFYHSACDDAQRLAADIGLGEFTSILDIGCGVGRLAIGLLALKVPFSSYLGIDVSKERVDWCTANLTTRDRRLQFQFIDVRNERYNPNGTAPLTLSVPPSSIDVVNLYSVFSHLREADLKAYLKIISEVLRADGACFLTMFVADDVPPVTENPTDFALLQWSGPLHCVRYDSSYWLKLIDQAGLVIEGCVPNVNIDGQTGFYLRKVQFPTNKRSQSRPAAGALEHRPDRRPTCFVGFFGLNRSLQWTYDSIRENVLDPLEAFGCEPVLAGHFNCPDTVHSPRSGEFHVPLETKSMRKLKLEICWLEPQTTDVFADLLPVLLATPLRQEDDPEGIVRLNVMHQLHSLRRLGSLLRLLGSRVFDFYCFLRPDLMYIDPMPVAEVFDLIQDKKTDLITADWHQWGGLNDRFAYCSFRGAQVYLNRIDLVRQFCVEKGMFHAESLLLYAAERAQLSCEFIAMRASRVRATGAVHDEKFGARDPSG